MVFPESIVDLIGNTPIVRLGRVVKDVRPTVLAKLEFLNPGGSVKDRIGLAMIRAAESAGRIIRGATIVEPSSGNTGVGLILACIQRGYSLVVTMPDKMSDEKRQLLEAYGAEVIICPTQVPTDSPEHYINVAKRIADETPNSYMPNQYFNEANPRVHYETTGREIWEQTEGRVTCLVAGMGTGGTISGAGRYLKEKNDRVKVVGVDPEGSILRELFSGETKAEPLLYKIEGIGEDFLPKTTDLRLIDEIVKVSDRESYAMSRRLAREEALLVGSSSGAAVAGALKVAGDMSDRELVVTILPDRGERYMSKLFDDNWMRSQGFL
jgi:cystathionine beta-synthase